MKELSIEEKAKAYDEAIENKDLCKTCKHYWIDFPLPLDRVISHCEIFDKKGGLSANMNEEVEYPCLKCPFNCYVKKN